MSNQTKNTKKANLKNCIKDLQFYFNAMCATEIMDDVELRKNFLSIIQELKELKKNKKKDD